MSETLYRMVDGVRVAIPESEAAGIRSEWATRPRLARREVPKLLIIDRLEAAGLGDAAEAALSANRAAKRRWDAASSIYADDGAVRAFLAAIGAEPDLILAP